MRSSSTVLVVAVFLASAVEMVEALTIVVAAGVSQGWRAALKGAAAAVIVLAALVAALGPALVHVPLNSLRAVIGAVLLIFGLQWLRKALLRATGYKAKHDEDAIFADQVAQIAKLDEGADTATGRQSVGFVVAFKGVFLEGLEVVIVVLALGGPQHQLALASLAAIAAVVVVGLAGVIVARQLAGVPENAMKMGVGLMLVSFGTFWTGEGLGAHWPGSDLAIPVLVGIYGATALAITAALNATRSPSATKAARVEP